MLTSDDSRGANSLVTAIITLFVYSLYAFELLTFETSIMILVVFLVIEVAYND
jgi:hypothetical protein